MKHSSFLAITLCLSAVQAASAGVKVLPVEVTLTGPQASHGRRAHGIHLALLRTQTHPFDQEVHETPIVGTIEHRIRVRAYPAPSHAPHDASPSADGQRKERQRVR